MTRHQDGPTSTEPVIDWSAVHGSEQFTVWASRRTSSATDFFAAGRGISAGRRTAWPSRVT